MHADGSGGGHHPHHYYGPGHQHVPHGDGRPYVVRAWSSPAYRAYLVRYAALTVLFVGLALLAVLTL